MAGYAVSQFHNVVKPTMLYCSKKWTVNWHSNLTIFLSIVSVSVCVYVRTCPSSLQTGLVKGVKLRQFSFFAVTAGITMLPWSTLGAVVPWKGLETVGVVLAGRLRPDGNTAVWGCVVWCHHSVRAVQTPRWPMTCTAVIGGASGRIGLRRLPHRR